MHNCSISAVSLDHCVHYSLFFFNDTATTEIYTLSLHDALPISACRQYERAGFELATEVLEMEVTLDADVPEPSLPDGVTLRTYTDADANAVRELLDEAYLGWDDAYVRLTHADWLAFMTEHDSFDPECWFLAERH